MNSILGRLMDSINDASDGLQLHKFSRFSWFNVIENVLVKPKLQISWAVISETLIFKMVIQCLTLFCVLSLQHLKFKETNLVMLQQFNALAQLRRVDQLTIDPQGNPVVNFTLWKYYVLFRLSHFSMQKINGTEVS